MHLLKIYANYNYSYQSSNAITNTMIKNKNNNYLSISSIYMVGGRGKKRDFGEEASASGDDGLRPYDLIYIFIFYFLFLSVNGTNPNLASCTPDLVIARAFMPVAIRSLNGYYGFLDSLRSLEMTTVTEQMPI